MPKPIPLSPSLPQHEAASARAARAAKIEARRARYAWNRGLSIAPLATPMPVPEGEHFEPFWTATVAVRVVALIDNLLAAAARLVEGNRIVLDTDLGSGDLKATLAVLRHLQWEQRQIIGMLPSLQGRRVDIEFDADDDDPWWEDALEWVMEMVASQALRRFLVSASGGRLKRAAQKATLDLASGLAGRFSDDGSRPMLSALGVWGRPTSIYDYAAQFRTLDLPVSASILFEDRLFARLRLAGPNPAWITRFTAEDPDLPVTEELFASAGDAEGDTFAAALADGRLYLADYPQLDGVETGAVASGAKYVGAPRALFVVRPTSRRFEPVCIQLQQRPGPDAPLFTPAHGAAWAVARLHLQVADACVHETMAHLGRTHLLVGAFKTAAERQLSDRHPVLVLLRPHLVGTLAINASAVASLIADGGIVDRLAAPVLRESGRLTVESVVGLDVRGAYLPNDLARRGVADPERLPDYPYRDDGMLHWEAIRAWTGDYVGVYYSDDDDVAADDELQAWRDELESPVGAHLQGVGPLQTRAELADLLTFVIFTASVQHAAVNFPQRDYMSVSPIMPLAAYAPPPTSTDLGDDVEAALLPHLPPLDQSFIQLTLAYLLGSTYYSRLGDYDLNRRSATFADPRLAAALARFQKRMTGIQYEIGRRNLDRIPYTTMLPTNVPQSINI